MVLAGSESEVFVAGDSLFPGFWDLGFSVADLVDFATVAVWSAGAVSLAAVTFFKGADFLGVGDSFKGGDFFND